jgi:hypothetical protein
MIADYEEISREKIRCYTALISEITPYYNPWNTEYKEVNQTII